MIRVSQVWFAVLLCDCVGDLKVNLPSSQIISGPRGQWVYLRYILQVLLHFRQRMVSLLTT